jgi:hypothetical protein
VIGLPGTYAGGASSGCVKAYVVREGVLATRSQPAAIFSFSTAHETPVGAPALGGGGSTARGLAGDAANSSTSSLERSI